jgi:hypothetical protein
MYAGRRKITMGQGNLKTAKKVETKSGDHYKITTPG